MADEGTTIAGIGTQLILDTAQFDAAIERSERRAKRFLDTLGSAQSRSITVPLGRGGGAAPSIYFPGGPGGGGSRDLHNLPVTLTAGAASVRQLRTQIRQQLGSEPIPLSFTVGRNRWGQLRNEISAGIGAVPIQVSYGGAKGGTLDVVTAVVAQASGISKVAARQQIRSAMASHGVDPQNLEKRERGGYVAANRPFLAGERGPEIITPRSSAMVTPAHEVARLRRELGALHSMGGYARAGRGAMAIPNFYRAISNAASRLTPETIAGGKAWYPQAAAYGAGMAQKFGIPTPTAQGILAVLSAGTEWKSNQTKFEKILQAHAAGRPFPYDLGLDAHRKAKAMIEGGNPADFVRGPKISQFHRGVSGDLSALTLDIWATRTSVAGEPLATDRMRKGIPPRSGATRDALVSAWHRAAAEAGMEPAEFQAALWLQEKADARARRGQSPGQVGLGFRRGGRVGIESAKDARIRSNKLGLNAIFQSADYKRRLGANAPFSADSSWLIGLDTGDISEPEDTPYFDAMARARGHMARGGWAEAYRQTLANRGGTFDATGHQPSRGYAVELGQGPIVPAGNRRAFAKAYRQMLGQAPYVGTWMPEGSDDIWVGSSAVERRRRDAERLALKQAQIAYFDLSKFEEGYPSWNPRHPSPGQMKLGMAHGGPAKRGGLPRGYKLEFITPDDPDLPASQFAWASDRQKLFGKSIKNATEAGTAMSWAGAPRQMIAAVVTDRRGNVVATAPFTVAGSNIGQPGGYLYPELTHVDPGHTGKGLANAMYVKAERFSGKQIKPAIGDQTQNGMALWLQKNRPFGRSYEDEIEVIRKTLATDLWVNGPSELYRGDLPRHWRHTRGEQVPRLPVDEMYDQELYNRRRAGWIKDYGRPLRLSVAGPRVGVPIGNRPLFETDDPIPRRARGGPADEYQRRLTQIHRLRLGRGDPGARLAALRQFGSVGTAQHELAFAQGRLARAATSAGEGPSWEDIDAALASLPTALHEPGMGSRFETKELLRRMAHVPFLGSGQGGDAARARDIFMGSHGYDFNHAHGYVSDQRASFRDPEMLRFALKKDYEYAEGEGFGFRPGANRGPGDWSRNAMGGMVKPISYGAGFAHAGAGAFASALHDVELANWKLPHEVATFLQPRTGKILLQRSGNQSSVGFDDVVNDPAMMAMLRGSVMTHNHPGGFRASPYLTTGISTALSRSLAHDVAKSRQPGKLPRELLEAMGNGLSIDDIGMGATLGLREVRATTPLFTYSMSTRRKSLPQGMALLGQLMEPDVRSDFFAKIHSGEWPTQLAQAFHHGELWDRATKDVPGLIHRRMLGIGQRASGGPAGPYIVNENGPELFVPRRLEHMIPPKVMAQIPQRAGGGMVEMNQKPWSLFNPPEDGWIVPSHLKNMVPRAAIGVGPKGRLKAAREAGRKAAEEQLADLSARLQEGYFESLGQDLSGRTLGSAVSGTFATPFRAANLRARTVAARERERAEQLGRVAIAGQAELPYLRELQTQQQARVVSAQGRVSRAGVGTDELRLAREGLTRWNRALNKTTVSIANWEKAGADFATQMEVAGKASAEARPGLLARGGTFGAVLVGSIAAQAISEVAQLAITTATKEGERFIDRSTGYSLTGQRVTSSLADSFRQTPNLGALFGQAGLAAGIGTALGAELQKLIGPLVTSKAGAKAQVEASDLYRTGIYAIGGGRPKGLTEDFGGVLGGPLLAEILGGTPSFSKSISRDLAAQPTYEQSVTFPQGYQNGPTIDLGAAFRNTGRLTQADSLRTSYVNDLNDAMARGALTAGEVASEFKLVKTDSKDMREQFAAVANDENAKAIADSGYALLDANGKAITSAQQWTKFLSQSAFGRTIGTPEQFLKANQLTLQAARQISAAQGALERQLFLPNQFAGAQYEAPSVTGQQLGPVAGAQGRFFGAGGGTFLAGIQSRLQTVQTSADARLEQAKVDVAAMASKISTSISPTAASDYRAAMDSVLDYGIQIANKQLAITRAQSGLRFAEIANNLRLAGRGLQDALGLAGRGGSRYGGLQREQTLLGFQLQQRDINLEKAVAGFQVAGETPEERASRQRAAGAKADVNQQLLDIARETFTITANRGVTDASITVGLLHRSQRVEAEVIANNAEIADLQQRQQRAMARAQSYVTEATRNINTELDISGEYVRRFGSSLNEADAKIREVLGLPERTTANTGGGGGKKKGASGLLGMTLGETQFIAGEVQGEAVAILKNPRIGTLGASVGGGGAMSLSVTFTGDVHVRNEADLTAIAQKIEERLAYRLQMVRR